MQRPNWDRIQEIYHAALALPCAERDAFVVNACAGNSDLLSEVNLLLDAVDPTGFLLSPVVKLSVVPKSLAGMTIDERYLIERQLCSGGMSHLFLAHDLRLKRRDVVIKILSEASLSSSYATSKFNDEIEALARLRHGGVVEILDTGKLADGRPYVVMEYIDGEMLRSQIPGEGMNLKRAAMILKQVGEALDHVHELGIIHRDLKPENIMLRRLSDSVVLLDFGIAKVKDSTTATSTVEGVTAGTVAYMSPEQLQGERVTAASDIYSLAVIAYELVTGRRPFNPTSPAQLLELQRAGVRAKPINLRPEISFKFQQILLRGLSFSPNARYQNASEFGADLWRELNAEIVQANHSLGKLVRKQPLVVCALIVLISVAAVFAFHELRSRTPAAGPKHSFTYWLTVQRMRNKKNYRASFNSHGEEMFESGDKFRLNISSSSPGYLYVFNEGPPATNDTSFKLIYPRPASNNGSATVGANQTVQSNWITFRGLTGAENFWIVWSVSPVAQLEAAKTEAFKQPRGGLTAQNLVNVKEFLTKKQSDMEISLHETSAIVSGKGDLLVKLSQFKHR